MSPAAIRVPATDRVVFDGQSLNNYPDNPPNLTFPERTMAGTGVLWFNVSVDGWSWTLLANGDGDPDMAPPVRRDPYVGQSATAVLVLVGGQGDLLEGDTAAQIYAQMGAYAESGRTAGFSHVIGTTIPRNSLSNPGVLRPATNALILADGDTYFDEVVDFDVAPIDDPNDLTYYLDGLHWAAAGAQAAADLVRPVLLPLVT